MEKAGGFRKQSPPQTDVPHEAIENQMAVQAKAYKQVALKNGIAIRYVFFP
jgi:hypothetical protein